MSKLQENFKTIIKKIEERITDPEELKFIKEQIADLSMLYIDELNKIMDLSERQVNQVFENQKLLEKKLERVERGMSTIEKELFVEDEYDFEIVCPYCNHEFVTEIDSNKKEVECPECHNIIELDWNGEEHDHECFDHHCGGCHGCSQEDDEIDEEIIQYNDDEIDDNDDDM